MMKNKIIPSLFFDSNAAEAAMFYSSIFPNSRVIDETPTAVTLQICDIEFIAINGGSVKFRPNPSISFMVVCESKTEINKLWDQLSGDGRVYMELGSYPWSDHYGWIGDKYGFTWQLYFGNLDDVHGQRMIPTFMFTGEQHGNCKEALAFYAQIFKDFQSDGLLFHEQGEMKGKVMHSQFRIQDFVLAAMDGGTDHDFKFNEAISLTVQCNDQNEIDYYWEHLTNMGKEIVCGWCQDKYGVYWQIVPHNIKELVYDAPNADNAFNALMKMKKINIQDLKLA